MVPRFIIFDGRSVFVERYFPVEQRVRARFQFQQFPDMAVDLADLDEAFAGRNDDPEFGAQIIVERRRLEPVVVQQSGTRL